MRRWMVFLALVAAMGLPAAATAADTVNAYSIWPENWARPMFQEFDPTLNRTPSA